MANILINAIAEAYPEIALASNVDSLVFINDKTPVATSRHGGFINNVEEVAEKMSKKLTPNCKTVRLMKAIIKNVEEK